MALTFTDLLTEFYARGFSYLDDGGAGVVRAKRFINDALHELDDMEPWPYLQASQSGTAPLTVSDLGRVEYVEDHTNQIKLGFATRDYLAGYYGDVTMTGSRPVWFYVTGGTTINVFPANTSVTLDVRYTKVEPDLVSDSDAPLVPDRYRMAIVHYAVASALEDKSNYQEAGAARARADQVVGRMREFYLLQAGAPAQETDVFGSEDW